MDMISYRESENVKTDKEWEEIAIERAKACGEQMAHTKQKLWDDAKAKWDKDLPKQGPITPIEPNDWKNASSVPQGGTKYDMGKPPLDLIDAEYLEGIARVLAFGANKYAAHNWRGGISYSRLIGAAYRHLGAINKGEDIDPESGEPHVYHLGCCNMFLASMMKHRKDLDNRYVVK